MANPRGAKTLPSLHKAPPLLDHVEHASLDTQLPSSNVGFRLLQKMGWKGKGLGKNEQGITEPIKSGIRDAKLGLGKQEEDDFFTAEENIQRKNCEMSKEEAVFSKDGMKGRYIFQPTYKYLTNSDRYTGDDLRHKEKEECQHGVIESCGMGEVFISYHMYVVNLVKLEDTHPYEKGDFGTGIKSQQHTRFRYIVDEGCDVAENLVGNEHNDDGHVRGEGV
ncbi:G patch domain-containing protein 8 [Tanacetum coccineum]